MRLGARLTFAALLILTSAPVHAQQQAPAAAFDALIAEAKAAMAGEPEKALPLASRASQVADGLGDPQRRALAHAEADWLRGEALTRVNKPEPARPIIAGALGTARATAPGSKLVADLMMSAAAIDWTTGRVREALVGFQQAHRIYGAVGDHRGQAKALQYIGTIYFDARDYPRMLRYYREAEEIYGGDPSLTISSLNNQGDALKEMRRFPEAILLYTRALKAARKMDSPTLEVRILTNIASAQYLAGRPAEANVTADRGLRRANAEETGWEPFLWGVKAQAAIARGDVEAAKRYLQRTFAGQDLERTTVQYREFHDAAYKLYRDLGDTALALRHLAAFKRLDDEARDVTASTNSALLAARFDFTNQELSIVNLKAGQLQRDVALERSRARLHRLTFYGLIAALIVALAVIVGTLFAFFSIRRSRNEVRAANATLSVTNDALETALQARTEFLATTSHEIRTPLNGILGMTQVLLADRTMDARTRARVQVVHGAGETMRALVDDLLDVAKMEAGEAVALEEDVRPITILEDIVRLWAGEAEAKGLSLTHAIAPEVPRIIRSDGGRLRQIVLNLISNAIKFTSSGAVVLSATIEGVDGAEALLVQVRDTGIGIPAECHESIFEPFKQVDGGTNRQYGGTGLGLAICRNLASLLDATIEVASRVGEGSTFSVRLLLRRVDEAPESARRERARTLAEARVMLVDANLLSQSMLRAVLTPVAGAVEVVTDIAELAARLDTGDSDIVLIDAGGFDDDGGAAVVETGARAAAGRGVGVAIMFKAQGRFSAADIGAWGALPIAKPLAAPTLIKHLAELVETPAVPTTVAA